MAVQIGSTAKVSRCVSTKASNSSIGGRCCRLGEKRAGQLQYLVGAAQFFVLSLKRFDMLALGGAHTFSLAGIDLITFDPIKQR